MNVNRPLPQSRRELAQHVVQDAAIVEIFELVERVDAADERHQVLTAPSAKTISACSVCARLQAVGEARGW